MNDPLLMQSEHQLRSLARIEAEAGKDGILDGMELVAEQFIDKLCQNVLAGNMSMEEITSACIVIKTHRDALARYKGAEAKHIKALSKIKLQ